MSAQRRPSRQHGQAGARATGTTRQWPRPARSDSAAISAHARTTLLDMGDTPRSAVSNNSATASPHDADEWKAAGSGSKYARPQPAQDYRVMGRHRKILFLRLAQVPRGALRGPVRTGVIARETPCPGRKRAFSACPIESVRRCGASRSRVSKNRLERTALCGWACRSSIGHGSPRKAFLKISF